jgi:hypothetical protein
MVSATAYNRRALGKIWNLHDLPKESPGYQILLQADLNGDLALGAAELDRIDWLAFSQAVKDFQQQQGLAPRDAKLGPLTLRRLRQCYGLTPDRPGVLKSLGELTFRPAATPVSEPDGPPLTGRTLAENRVCDLWNRYGAAIYRQARAYRLPVAAALAVFAVESQMAYDPRTGLVIIRFEPHIFRRQAKRNVLYSRGGQEHEWRNLAQAYDLNAEAALWSTSWGLPQLMGFNWRLTRHPSLQAMVLAFQDSCEAQVAGFFEFTAQNGLGRYMLNADWQGFTRRYNGPGQVAVYAARLVSALKAVNSLQENGARFAAYPAPEEFGT